MKNAEKKNTPERAQASEQINAVIRSLQASLKYKFYDSVNCFYLSPEDFVIQDNRLKHVDLDKKISSSLDLSRIVPMRLLNKKDEHGSDIYQTDIVKFAYNDYQVIMVKDESSLSDGRFVRLGNYFENPELRELLR